MNNQGQPIRVHNGGNSHSARPSGNRLGNETRAQAQAGARGQQTYQEQMIQAGQFKILCRKCSRQCLKALFE